MDPVTTFFLALGKWLDLRILIYTALPEAQKTAAAVRLFDTEARVQGWLDKGAAKIGLGPLAEDHTPLVVPAHVDGKS